MPDDRPLVLYNGATGGLGRYMAAELDRLGLGNRPLLSRLEDRAGLEEELARILPTGPVTLIHMAAMVSVPACEADPDAAYDINVSLAASTVRSVLKWANSRGVDTRIIYVSSGHVYAAPSSESPVGENDATQPRSVYATTKLQAEEALSSLATSLGAPFLSARVFGLLAPEQAPHYVLPAMIRRVSRRDFRDVPGLDHVRDYLDARDVCRDLGLIASLDRRFSGPVNVCSGRPTTIRDLLRMVTSAIDVDLLQNVTDSLASGPGRPDDVRWLVGNPSRFQQLTRAAPQQIPIKRTVADAVAAADAGSRTK